MSNNEHDRTARAQVDSIGMPDGEPNFLPDPVQDRLIETIIALGGELWIERERRMRLESLLAAKKLLTAEELEAYSVTDDELAEQRETLNAFVNRLLGPLTTLPGDKK